MYNSIEGLQEDLDKWLEYYNNERPHSGRYCFGKTPMETWLDSKELAKQKSIDQLYEKAEVSA
jgi:hypothetical protein